MRSPSCLLCILLLILLPLLHADAAVADVAVPQQHYDLETGREVALLAGSGIVLAGALFLQRRLEPLDESQVDQLEGSGLDAGLLGLEGSARRRWSPKANRVSNVTLGLSVLGPAWQAIAEGESTGDDTGTLFVMYGETLLLTSALNQLAKGLAHRTRPFVHNPDPRIPPELKREIDARRSFYSGHSAASFASAVHFSMVYEGINGNQSSGAVWGASLGLATLTGCLRYVAGKHYLSDILVGAALGSFVGWLIPTLHEMDDSSPTTTSPMLTFGFGF